MPDPVGSGRSRRSGAPAHPTASGGVEGDISAGVGSRREARERALGLLYEAETKGLAPAELVAELPVPLHGYAADLLGGVDAERGAIDAVISRFAQNWDLDRMPALDRAVLRLAGYELGHRADVPTSVVLNEAVELAQRYSTIDSGRFVNGLLARMAIELRGSDASAEPPLHDPRYE